MDDVHCADEDIRTLLGFVALGRATEEEHQAVTAHLTACAACRAERVEIDQVVAALGLLSVADVRELIEESNLPEAPAQPAADSHLFGAPGAPDARALPRPSPIAQRRVLSRDDDPSSRGRASSRRIEGYLAPRPATGPLARGPHPHRRARLRRSSGALAFGLVGLIAATAGVWAAAGRGPAADELGPVVAVAATTDDGSGVDLSATLYQEAPDRVSMRLTASGLGPGEYQLYAVTDNGEDLLLGRLASTPEGGSFAGDIPVGANNLWYLSIKENDGTVMAQATVEAGSPPD
uniref:zf-HC2 domain-containing protein n=1 Tax=Paractinoplanes polyasparticus TaxID=2856853 RepID=UPI001C84E086|nr:zf-HC2 domain-containing protein [Actinoplanes polyasparticus]